MHAILSSVAAMHNCCKSQFDESTVIRLGLCVLCFAHLKNTIWWISNSFIPQYQDIIELYKIILRTAQRLLSNTLRDEVTKVLS